jgi:transcriptional regulator with XRE-family HTH domain
VAPMWRAAVDPVKRGGGALIDRLSVPERKALGARLRERRERKGLYQAEVAEQVGCTRFSVMKWEAGKAIPQREMQAKVAELYGVAQAELFAEVYAAIGRPPRRRRRPKVSHPVAAA